MTFCSSQDALEPSISPFKHLLYQPDQRYIDPKLPSTIECSSMNRHTKTWNGQTGKAKREKQTIKITHDMPILIDSRYIILKCFSC